MTEDIELMRMQAERGELLMALAQAQAMISQASTRVNEISAKIKAHQDRHDNGHGWASHQARTEAAEASVAQSVASTLDGNPVVASPPCPR